MQETDVGATVAAAILGLIAAAEAVLLVFGGVRYRRYRQQERGLVLARALQVQAGRTTTMTTTETDTEPEPEPELEATAPIPLRFGIVRPRTTPPPPPIILQSPAEFL